MDVIFRNFRKEDGQEFLRLAYRGLDFSGTGDSIYETHQTNHLYYVRRTEKSVIVRRIDDSQKDSGS